MMNRLRVQKHRKANTCDLKDLPSSLLQLQRKYFEEDEAKRSIFRGYIFRVFLKVIVFGGFVIK